MSDQKQKGKGSKTLKLFLIIVAVLLVPITMDQLDVDRDQLRIAGRIAAGVAGLLFVYGLFAKLMKAVGFVVMLLLIGGVVLVSEQQVEMPRIKKLLEARETSQPK